MNTKRLKLALEEACISQVVLAERLGVNKSMVSHYLKGTYKPSRKRLEEIANITNKSVEWLNSKDEILIKNTVNVPVMEAAKMLGMGIETLKCYLKSGQAPFGFASKRKHYTYYINRKRLENYLRGEVI